MSVGVPSLIDLSLQALVKNIHRVHSLCGLPEELVIELFTLVLQESRLTPKILEVFKRTEHEELLEYIETLNIQPLPVLITYDVPRRKYF